MLWFGGAEGGWDEVVWWRVEEWDEVVGEGGWDEVLWERGRRMGLGALGKGKEDGMRWLGRGRSTG